jgi:hypothetical protein
MRNTLRAAMAVLAFGIWQAPAGAETVQGTARVGNRTIALPPGTWEIVSTSADPTPGIHAEQRRETLVRLSAGKVNGLVTIAVSSKASVPGQAYIPLRTCALRDAFHSATRNDGADEGSCVAVTHALLRLTGMQSSGEFTSPTTREGAGERAMLQVITARDDRLNFLSVTYVFPADGFGAPAEEAAWEKSPWHPARLDAPRRAVMERLKTWAEKAQEQTRLSFRNRPVTPLPEP